MLKPRFPSTLVRPSFENYQVQCVKCINNMMSDFLAGGAGYPPEQFLKPIGNKWIGTCVSQLHLDFFLLYQGA